MEEKRILADGMLGKLSRILRMVGHDVVYAPDENLENDKEIERYAKENKPSIAPDFIDEIWKCRNCGKYYWKGSHWEDLKETIKNLD